MPHNGVNNGTNDLNKKHIVFLLPTHSRYPIGGFKIVYEYSNYLVDHGYRITIIYPGTLLLERRSFIEQTKSILRFFFYGINRKYKPYGWFNLDKRINLKFVWNLYEKNIPTADLIIATAMETAIYLNKYKKINNENKFYFIQGFEEWNWGKEEVIATWKYKLNKIVIAEWLKEKIESVGQKAILIHNGFDFSKFSRKIAPENKNKYNLAMLYHDSVLKGCKIGLSAIDMVKKIYPQTSVTIFGIPARPSDLPDWIQYYRNPSQEKLNNIYNDSAIFVGPSFSEGFSLTIPEAMQCGCAVVCTNIGGYTVVAKDQITALVCPPGDIASLADNIIMLIKDDQLRYRIADNAYNNIRSYTWDKAFKNMKNVLENYSELLN